MKRGYTALEYRSIVRRLRKARPDVSLSSDFIVGFPGESDADFEATLQLARELQFDGAYSFLYSPRPGTPAAELQDAVPAEEKHERLQRLQALLEEQAAAFSAAMVGTVQRVLVQGPSKRDAAELAARTGEQPDGEFRGARRPGRSLRRSRASPRRGITRCAASWSARPCAPCMRPKSAAHPVEIRLDPVDNQRLARLCGALDENLRQIETALDVEIARRGARFSVRGAPSRRSARRRALEHFYATRHGRTEHRRRAARPGRNRPARMSRAQDESEIPAPDAPAGPARPHAAPGRSTSTASSRTTSPSASAPPAPARPISRSPARWTRWSATRSSASCWCGPRSRPASGSASCPATSRRRSIRTCGRSTTRSTT